MKRIFVAASAVAISMPLAVGAVPTAQAAPTAVTGTTSTTRVNRTTAVSYANLYSRKAARSSATQRHRHAVHLGTLTKRANMPLNRRARLIAPALKGVPYRWGGTTTRGFDCSGYTGYVYGKAGKKLPRTARMQYRATKRVKHPAPGDLVFFGGSRAYHVGLYIGNGRMIHAPRAGKPVQITKIWRGASYGRVR